MNRSSKVPYAPSPLHSLTSVYNNSESFRYKTLDPNCKFLSAWNRVFLAVCLAALFIDPLSFFVPYVPAPFCIDRNQDILMIFTVLRSLGDIFYYVNIIFKFRTAFILPGSAVIGRGDLVMDPGEIARHYLKSDFKTDFAAAFPLPQVMNWIVIPSLNNNRVYKHPSDVLALIALIQYVPRFYIIFPLILRIIENNGFVTKTATAGTAYNLMLYMLASHVIGASWYLLSLHRQRNCWVLECEKDMIGASTCYDSYMDCRSLRTDYDTSRREAWLRVTPVLANCAAKNKEAHLKYGLYAEAITGTVFSLNFTDKYLYCLWWGLKNLSSYGQTLEAGGYLKETIFCFFICSSGLLLFGFLIANIQMYLQSVVTRLDKWRDKLTKTKKWMRKHQLPLVLQERIHKFWHLKWLVTRGIDEDTIVRFLPLDFRRGVQRHLCLHLVHRVHFFSKMDSHLLDAICERLVSSLNIADAYVVHEGDPVDEMLFIIKGELKSFTTDGGRSGFFNSVQVRPGDYCGEELLTWALMPTPTNVLPSSTRTVQTLSDVEAFALRAEDLKYVADQFKRFHSMEIQQIFRFYSHQWRTWGACCIQAAWKQFKKKKQLQELRRSERLNYNLDQHNSTKREYEDTGTENMNKLATTYWAACTIQAAWRLYKNKKM